ncbi:MAG: recombinase family protein [Thermoplasmata archaeon]
MAARNAESRKVACERCWSEDEVRVDEAGLALCGPCQAHRPKDPFLLESLFLPFASRKELLRHYGVEDSTAALTRWADQHGLSARDAAARLLRDPGARALVGREAVLRMWPRTRTTPFGYAEEDGTLVPDSREARAVSDFYCMYREGMSLRQIAEVMNRRHLPTSRGGRWRASTIRYILRNPIYIGLVRRNGMVREGGPPGLVEVPLFETVQRRLTRRAKRAQRAVQEASSLPGI